MPGKSLRTQREANEFVVARQLDVRTICEEVIAFRPSGSFYLRQGAYVELQCLIVLPFDLQFRLEFFNQQLQSRDLGT